MRATRMPALPLSTESQSVASTPPLSARPNPNRQDRDEIQYQVEAACPPAPSVGGRESERQSAREVPRGLRSNIEAPIVHRLRHSATQVVEKQGSLRATTTVVQASCARESARVSAVS